MTSVQASAFTKVRFKEIVTEGALQDGPQTMAGVSGEGEEGGGGPEWRDDSCDSVTTFGDTIRLSVCPRTPTRFDATVHRLSARPRPTGHRGPPFGQPLQGPASGESLPAEVSALQRWRLTRSVRSREGLSDVSRHACGQPPDGPTAFTGLLGKQLLQVPRSAGVRYNNRQYPPLHSSWSDGPQRALNPWE